MKNSDEPALSYNDAVEDALCFGCIDSTIRNIYSSHRAQRFTPRKLGVLIRDTIYIQFHPFFSCTA